MLTAAINHMTMCAAPYTSLLATAKATACVGVEIRNDLDSKLFDGQDYQQAGREAADQGIRLLALAEVSAFNDLSDRAWHDVQALASIAKACGAEAISLIPRNDGNGCEPEERLQNLKSTLLKFAPVLRQYDLLGFIEPLGFESASLRYKAEVVSVLTELQLTREFQLVHDTFHHYLSGEDELFPEHTGMVHVSGVIDKQLQSSQMLDEHRVLVDDQDRLKNIEQLTQLSQRGYKGPVSIEAFAPEVHQLDSAKDSLLACFKYIESNITR